MKILFSSLFILFTVGMTSCTNTDQKQNQNNGNSDTSMKSMDATGPMRDTPQDTTTIKPLPGDSVPMRDNKN